MSTTWIEGYGLVHVAGGKSPVERDATIQYLIDTAPKYEELNFLGSFKSALDDSIIYRKWLDRNTPSFYLDKLLEEKKITEEEYQQALKEGIFRQKFPEVRESIEDSYIKAGGSKRRIEAGREFELDMAQQEAHKRRWITDEMEKWGNAIGWYDSIALEEYYTTLSKARNLKPEEEADRIANNSMLDAISDDMNLAYENTWLRGNGNFDVSDVQKKYGYEEEELNTLQTMKAAYDFATQNPGAFVGSLAGMVVADPELLLINFARIPAVVTRSAQAGQNLVRAGLGIKPKYYQSFEKMSKAQKLGYGALGRGVEGAVYGGVYEGMRDLTFQGHIDSQNLQNGLAMGALFGTAFGGVTGHLGKDISRNWMLNKTGSARMRENFNKIKSQLGGLKYSEFKGSDGKPVQGLGWNAKWQGNIQNTLKAQQQKKATKKAEAKTGVAQEVDNPDFRDLTKVDRPSSGGAVKVVLPEGLNHSSRGDLWRAKAIETLDETLNAGKKDADKTPLEQVAREVDNGIIDREISLSAELDGNGKPKYTMKEVKGLAAKQEAAFQEFQLKEKIGKKDYDVRRRETGNKSYLDKEWGTQREIDYVNDLRSTLDPTGEGVGGQSVRESSSFATVMKNYDAKNEGRVITNASRFRAGIIGAAAGLYVTSENPDNMALGSFLGMGLGILARQKLPQISRSKAAMKSKVYQSANEAENITKELQYKTNFVMKTMERVLKNKNARITSEQFIDYLENYTLPKKGQKNQHGNTFAQVAKIIQERKKLESKYPEIGEAMEAYQNLMAVFKETAKEFGVLLDEQQIIDYVTHILRKPNRTSNDIVLKIANKTGLKNKSPFDNFRSHIGTIKKIKEEGYDIETDIFKILDAYTRSMSKAIVGRVILRDVKNTKIVHGKYDIGLIVNKGEKIAKIARDELGYVTSDHPALQNQLIHPTIHSALDQFFVINKGGLGDKILAVNNTIKRATLAQSFFHAQALLLSGIYSGMYFNLATPTGIARMRKIHQMMKGEWSPEAVATDLNGKPLYKRGLNGAIEVDADGKPIKLYGDYKHKALVNELAQTKMGIGVARNNELVLPGYRSYKNILEKYKILKPVDKVQNFVDKGTWDLLHDYSKIYTYLMMKERMMSPNARGIGKFKIVADDWHGLSEKDAMVAAAAFTDDAFGGQSMTRIAAEWAEIAVKEADNPKGMLAAVGSAMANPNAMKYSNLVLFSPDWTLSNIRIAFRGMGMSTRGIDKIISSKGKAKLTNKEVAELNMYLGYTTRGLLATSFFAYMIHKFFAKADDEFDLLEFWKTGRLSLGLGEELVVSKQIAEPMHWIMNPFHTGLSKASVIPKTALEVFFGKEYLSLKQGTLTGRKLDRSDPLDWAFWATSKVTPISFSPLSSFGRSFIDKDYKGAPDSLKDALWKVATNAIGFPKYYKEETIDVTK
jgi:hypothetical protein